MANVVIGFIAGTLGALVVFLVFTRLSGASRFSAPFGVIFIGITCATLSHFLSPWATPLVIIVYASACAGQYLQERKTCEAEHKLKDSSE